MKETIIAVDDEQFALMDLKSAIKEALTDSTVICFDTPTAAIEYAKSNQVDVAFLDIEMGGMNGIALAKHLKDIYSKTNIIFVTGYSQYALDAHSIFPTGYLMKPVTVEAILEAMEHLRHPIEPKPDKRIRINTFGNFEVFVDGSPLRFARSKTKELFAYLVSKQGALCSNNEIISVIWENKQDTPALQSYYQNLTADLTKTLSDADVNDVLIKQRGFLGVAVNKVSCDLYDFCAGINVNRYMGEFMKQYSWAEFTNAYLERLAG